MAWIIGQRRNVAKIKQFRRRLLIQIEIFTIYRLYLTCCTDYNSDFHEQHAFQTSEYRYTVTFFFFNYKMHIIVWIRQWFIVALKRITRLYTMLHYRRHTQISGTPSTTFRYLFFRLPGAVCLCFHYTNTFKIMLQSKDQGYWILGGCTYAQSRGNLISALVPFSDVPFDGRSYSVIKHR